MDEPCKVCGLDHGQDHTPCFEVKDLRSRIAELEAERDRTKNDSIVLETILKCICYDTKHRCWLISEIDIDAIDKYGLARAALRREGSDG